MVDKTNRDFNHKYLAGGYCRLSKEDLKNNRKSNNSESIETQMSLIRSYLKDNEEIENISLVDYYIDDGVTGTITARASYQRLLEDVKRKKVNTIIIKDLSRLSRNLADTTNFLEYEITEKKIRLISLGDGFDSLYKSESDISMIFKAVMNSAYADDISNKVLINLNAKRYDGKFIGSFAPYGYRKDINDKNHLIIDEAAANVVKFIFSLFLSGVSKNEIARTLNSKGIPCPTEYKKQNKSNYEPSRNDLKNFLWTYSTINKILGSEVYIGTLVQRRTKMERIRKNELTYKRKTAVTKDKQIRVEHTHEPIIEEDVFNTAQSLTKNISKCSKNLRHVSIFSGILKCGECGRALTKSVSKIGQGKTANYYRCSTYKNYNAKSENNINDIGCTAHSIREDLLVRIVIDAIKSEALKCLNNTDIKNLKDYLNKLNKNNKDTLFLEAKNNELEKINKKRQKNLDAYYEELISKDIFKRQDLFYLEEENKISQIIKSLSSSINNEECGKKEYEMWIERFINYCNIEELTREVVVSLIDKIIIYENKEMYIYFKFKPF